MWYRNLIAFCFLLFSYNIVAQNIAWDLGMNFFFDNNEFATSTLTKDQTMTGVHVTPQVGLALDTTQNFYIGTDFLKTLGSVHYMDDIQLIAYYCRKTDKSSFFAGVFPRAELLSNYSDLFFQDSVKYYKPTMHGVFWQIGNTQSFVNVWLDWTGHQTATKRESFFLGASAHKKMNCFQLDLESYLFHLANIRPFNPDFSVCDNALVHLSAGVGKSNKSGSNSFFFAIGMLGGFERERKVSMKPQIPLGLVLRANAELGRFGTQNTFYAGDPHMIFYDKYKTDLYWNNPFLRSNYYLESKWFYRIISSAFVQGNAALKFHFSKGKLFSEQTFVVSISLNNESKKKLNI